METAAKKQRYYISFTNTLNNFFLGKIAFEDLKEGMFVIGRDRGAVVNGSIPARISSFNKEKPQLMATHVPGGVIPSDALDTEVRQKWTKFINLLQEKEQAGSIIWHRTNGESYLRLIVEYLRAGHDVIFDGESQKLEHYTWLDDETLQKPKKKKRDPQEPQPFGIDELIRVGAAPVPARRRNNEDERRQRYVAELRDGARDEPMPDRVEGYQVYARRQNEDEQG